MADANNASSILPRTSSETGLLLLPVRGEKRIIPVVYDADSGFTMQGRTMSIESQDFAISAALAPFSQYVQVRLPGRGVDAQGNSDPTTSAFYQFMINPAQISVQRQQLATQSMARAGWQIGVKGEDFITVSMEGRTPGRYFSNGLTDVLPDFSASFRSLAALELVVENNGYWFEGEQAGEGPLANDFTRRQIKMHSDVELTVGEFIWYGMFDTLDIRDDAQNPYLSTFAITFVAWREHYRSESPYTNPIGGATTYGHAPGVATVYAPPASQSQPVPQLPLPDGATTTVPLSSLTPGYVSPSSAGLSQPSTGTPQPNLPAYDTTPTNLIVNPTSFNWNTQ